MTHNTHYMYPVKFMIDRSSLDNGITMKLSEDGSGRGAAMVAAVAHRLKKQS